MAAMGLAVEELCALSHLRWLPVGMRRKREAASRLGAAESQMMSAMMEVMVAGNDAPIAVAEDVYDLLFKFDRSQPLTSHKNEQITVDLGEALTKFGAACRADLWYLPQWWQVWRPAWWGVRWRSLKRQHTAKRAHKRAVRVRNV
ncbi:hypothetical protein [Streptomyces microflavus]|uniref:hypothetical protein n=1 Tax=Streptomyces microflavus TaxID=1919 RepID=UPI0033E8AC9A